MHVQTHIMSGWCVANCFALTPRERVFCMVAASIADVDGLGIVRGPLSSAYLNYHHVLAHSLPFGLIACAVLTIFSTHRIKALVLFLALFHLHLLLDYFGSGPGWDIFYLWPVSHFRIPNSYSWEFYSIQNISFAFLLFLWTLLIAVRAGRTPLEILMPNLDRQIVELLRKWLRHSGKAPADGADSTKPN
jgi:inner membrane protein